MSRTYKATGINLKSMPMGEADRLLTILTREFGLIRAVAMGSRKHNSSLGGRSGLFVVNELLIAKGRSLDKVTQAETLESYPGLSQDLKKLTASQYLAELSLCQALSEQPQEELFYLLNEHLKRLERSSASRVLSHLTHAVFQLLILSGVAPQVHLCCITRQPITPDFTDSNWRIGFSIPSGGTVTLEALEKLRVEKRRPHQSSATGGQGVVEAKQALTPNQLQRPQNQQPQYQHQVAEAEVKYRIHQPPSMMNVQLTAAELLLLQQLARAELFDPEEMREYEGQANGNGSVTFASSSNPSHTSDSGENSSLLERAWHSVEKILRYYAQYHFDRPIRSATLIDACFAPAD